MSKFAGSINEFQIDFLKSSSIDLREQRFSQHKDSLLRSNAASFDHDEVILNDSVMREPSEGCDILLREIIVCGGIVLSTSSGTLSESEDLLVHFGSVMVTRLTGSGNSPSDSFWMPGTDTTDLAVPSMGLLLQVADTESLHDTTESLTFCDTKDIEVLVLLEYGVNAHLLLEQVITEFDLVFDGATVELDLHNVVLLLSDVQKLHLGVGDHSNHCAVLLDSGKFNLNGLLLTVFLGIFAEGLLLGVHPILVESSQGVLV